MLSALILFALCGDDPPPSAPRKAFTRAFIVQRRPLSLDLGDHLAIIIESAPDSFNFSVRTADGTTREHPRPYSTSNLMLMGQSAILDSVSESAEIPLWVIPAHLCSNASLVLSAEHLLSLKAKSSPRQSSGPICLFTQSHFDSVQLSVLVQTRDPEAQIELFGPDNSHEAVKVCRPGELCFFRSEAPFFLRLEGDHQRIQSLQLDYAVSGAAPSIAYCSAISIPFLHGRGYAQITQVLGGVSLFCRSRAREVLGLLTHVSRGIAVALLVMLALDCFGIVSIAEWLCRNQENQRFAALKKDPYAGEIVAV
jgi:hypothetical protein